MDNVPGHDESEWQPRPVAVLERIHMTSEPIRDPRTDSLLTPQNAALIVIDYQPSQIQSVRSMDHDVLVDNIVSVARLSKTYGLPIVLSTVNVANGQEPTLPELKAVLSDSDEIDRTQINSWEDVEFRSAVEATGRKKLIMAALWTEVCLAFPTLDACGKGSRSIPLLTRLEGPHPKRIVPAWRGSFGPEHSRSAGCPSHASFNGTGRGPRRFPTSLTSCLLLAC
jgi:hypothetical protein